MRFLRPFAFVLLASQGAASAALAQTQMLPMQNLTVPFPSQQKPAPPPAQPSLSTGAQAQPKTAAGRVKFAERLAASFTAHGFSMRVSSQESGGDARLAPRLVIQGAFDDPFIHRMISTGNFLGPAAQTGFRSAELVSITSRRSTAFDLSSGRPPKCDVTGRICN